MVRLTLRWLVEFAVAAGLTLYFAGKVYASLSRLAADKTGTAHSIVNDDQVKYPALMACPKTWGKVPRGFPHLAPLNESILEKITYTEVTRDG